MAKRKDRRIRWQNPETQHGLDEHSTAWQHATVSLLKPLQAQSVWNGEPRRLTPRKGVTTTEAWLQLWPVTWNGDGQAKSWVESSVAWVWWDEAWWVVKREGLRVESRLGEPVPNTKAWWQQQGLQGCEGSLEVRVIPPEFWERGFHTAPRPLKAEAEPDT